MSVTVEVATITGTAEETVAKSGDLRVEDGHLLDVEQGTSGRVIAVYKPNVWVTAKVD